MSYHYLSAGAPGPSAAAAVDAGGALTAGLQAASERLRLVVEEVMARRMADIMKVANQSALAQSASILALSAVPVVGNVLALVSGAVQKVFGASWKQKAEARLEEAKNKISVWAAESEGRIHQRVSEVFNQEKPTSIKILIKHVVTNDPIDRLANPSTPANGMDGVFSKIGKWVQKNVYDKVTGREVFTKARSAAEEAESEAQKIIQQNEQDLLKLINSPEYRVSLRISTVKELLKDSLIQQAATDLRKTLNQSMIPWPVVIPVAGAAALLFLLAMRR